MEVLSLGQRFELAALTRDVVKRIAELTHELQPSELMQAMSCAKLYNLPVLKRACNDRIGSIGIKILKDDSIYGILKEDPAFYQEVVDAIQKRNFLEVGQRTLL